MVRIGAAMVVLGFVVGFHEGDERRRGVMGWVMIDRRW